MKNKPTDRELTGWDKVWLAFILIICVYFISHLFVSCSSKHDELTPTYKSLEGTWTFEKPTMKANFTIQNTSNQLVVTSGTYDLRDQNFNWHHYTVGTKFILKTPISYLKLQETDINYYMSIEVDSINSTYTKFKSHNTSSGSLRSENISELNTYITRVP